MCKQTLFQVLYIDFTFMYLSGLQYVYIFIHFMHVMVDMELFHHPPTGNSFSMVVEPGRSS